MAHFRRVANAGNTGGEVAERFVFDEQQEGVDR